MLLSCLKYFHFLLFLITLQKETFNHKLYFGRKERTICKKRFGYEQKNASKKRHSSLLINHKDTLQILIFF